jgi:hypothetical protein
MEIVSEINRGKWCFGNFDLFSFLPHWNLYDKFTPFLIYDHASKFTLFLITQL